MDRRFYDEYQGNNEFHMQPTAEGNDGYQQDPNNNYNNNNYYNDQQYQYDDYGQNQNQQYYDDYGQQPDQYYSQQEQQEYQQYGELYQDPVEVQQQVLPQAEEVKAGGGAVVGSAPQLDKIPLEKAYVPLLDATHQEFKVFKPQLTGGHILYVAKGVDRQGPWEGQRRYSQFFCLYEALVSRWPGILIPKLPPKQRIGNQEVKFIYERRFYLERFLRKCANHDFIINSEEFLCFSRPNGDVEKQISKLPKMPSGTLVERMRKATNVNERMFDLSEKDRFNNSITEFTYFTKKVIPQLKIMKKTIRGCKQVKHSGNSSYRGLLNLLDKYEELNMQSYVDGNTEKMVIGDPKNKLLKDRMNRMAQSLRNPFEEMYHWCKGEIYDLQALFNAVSCKQDLEKYERKLESKKNEAKEDLDSVNTGKKTVRTLFKNEKDTTEMQSTIENSEKEIENYKLLIEIVTIYLGEQVIPSFKREKLLLYGKVLQQFNTQEIKNSHQVASFWNKVRSNPNVKEVMQQQAK